MFANKMEKLASGKKGDQKKSAQVAQMRKKAMQMGFSQDADGQKYGKKSVTGARAGSIEQAIGHRVNQIGQGGGRLSLAAVAASMSDGGGGGGGEAPFRVKFHIPCTLNKPRVAVLQLDDVKVTSDTNGRVTATGPVNTAVPDLQPEIDQA